MTTQQILDALTCDRRSCQCHASARRGRGKTHCPCHDDPGPSLNVTPRRDTVLLHCFGGCSNDDVIAALRERGLWPDKPVATRALRTKRWTIKTAGGEAVAVHVRQDLPDGGKRVWWDGGLNGLPVADLPLYGIERLNGQQGVIVTEGEKAADALLDLGIPAVGTVTGAATTPSDDTLRSLLGVKVYLWPDADTEGHAHMQRIGQRLTALGHEDVSVIAWTEAPPKGDACDFVAGGGDRESVRDLCRSAPAWEPDLHSYQIPLVGVSDSVRIAEIPDSGAEKFVSDSYRGFRTLTLSEVAQASVPPAEWLVEGLFAMGSLTLLTGRPKGGKSIFAADLGASVAIGEPFLDLAVMQGPTLFYQAEDQFALTRSRLLTRIPNYEDVPFHMIPLTDPDDEPLRLDDPASFERLIETVERIEPRLLILDPLRELHDLNENDSDYMAPLLRPLRRLTHEKGMMTLLVHHAGWAGRSRGSTAIIGAVDNVFHLDTPNDGDDLSPERVSTLTGEGRSHPEHRRLAIRLRPGLRWGATSEGHRTDLDADERIQRHLDHTQRWVEVDDLVEDLKLPKSTVQNTLRDLHKAGKVARSGEGAKGKPFRYATPALRQNPDTRDTNDGTNFSASESRKQPIRTESETHTPEIRYESDSCARCGAQADERLSDRGLCWR